MTDINKLEELAKAANKLFLSGPWHYNDPERFSQGHGKFSETAVYAAGNAFPWRVIEVEGDNDRSVALAKLIAELRPEVVVSIISKYRRMEEALKWYGDQMCEGPHPDGCGKLSHDYCAGCAARQALQSTEQQG